MPKGKAFHKCKDSRFSRGTVCREGNYISRAGVYYSKNKTHTSSSVTKVAQCNQTATVQLAGLPGEWCRVGLCCWQIGCSAVLHSLVGFAKWKDVFLSP